MRVPINRVLVVGRANVGKSTLCNGLLGYTRSIVYDQPGTTRDLVADSADWGSGAFQLCDTRGVFGDEDLEWIAERLKSTSAAIFVVDSSCGVTPFDRSLSEILRRSNLPVLVVVNKSDHKNRVTALEFAELGFDKVFEISAAHRQGMEDVRAWVVLQQGLNSNSLSEHRPELKLAIIGRPNTGKSTLLNRLAREKISNVSPEALTTRDTVYFDCRHQGKLVRIIDTAGVRRPRSEMGAVEELSIKFSTDTIDRADVVFLMIDSREGMTDQDRRLLSLIERRSKSAAILLNFWDQINRSEQRNLLSDSTIARRFFESCPISGKTGYNLNRLLPLAMKLFENSSKRFGTSRVNTVVRAIVDKNPPPSRGRGNFNILYAIQATAKPPTFVFFMNRKENFPRSYQLYLENELRKEFGYSSQPIRLLFRAKSNPKHA